MNREPSTVPQAGVTIRPSQSRHNRIWILEVVKCPYCENVHFHGSGPVALLPLLGHRVAHCVTRQSPLGEYELIAVEEPV